MRKVLIIGNGGSAKAVLREIEQITKSKTKIIVISAPATGVSCTGVDFGKQFQSEPFIIKDYHLAERIDYKPIVSTKKHNIPHKHKSKRPYHD